VRGPRPAIPQFGAIDPGPSVVHQVYYGVVVYGAGSSAKRGGQTYPLFGISLSSLSTQKKKGVLSALTAVAATSSATLRGAKYVHDSRAIGIGQCEFLALFAPRCGRDMHLYISSQGVN
jgi:hypothetical protein